ncbi:hypothetical protein [uncultured Clostridium sp.]|uniref:hypothetical protein n=1 Tax=uncultured Clostridium sp. TaxID=59620 RepID=UPI0025E4ABA1|nr:hypothetical protein [uncultured Clostridium sp.]
MDIKTIVEIIAGLLGITGLSIIFTVNKNRNKDSNKIKSINQQAISKDKVYQSGRDTNVK